MSKELSGKGKTMDYSAGFVQLISTPVVIIEYLFSTAVIQRLVRYCCNGSKVVYGTFLKSNREAENHFNEQMYDFSFPVYVSKMDKDLYRDQPFVTVVAAPRVMLLVYDGPQVQLQRGLGLQDRNQGPVVRNLINATPQMMINI